MVIINCNFGENLYKCFKRSLKGCEDSTLVDHQLCIPWDLGSIPGMYAEDRSKERINGQPLVNLTNIEVFLTA